MHCVGSYPDARTVWFKPLMHVFLFFFGYISHAGFHSVVHTIEAVITARQHGSPLRWIDVGPSGSSAVEAVKEKLGFTVTDKWRDEGWCDYEGSYTDLFALTP